MRQPRLQQGFLRAVRDHNAQPGAGIEPQLGDRRLHQGLDDQGLAGIGLLRAVVVVLDEDEGMLGRQGVAQPPLHARDGG